MNINIYGGGLTGLTIAFELSKYKDFTISLFEKETILGGMAKSKNTKDNVPSEHSWRGYGPFYYNTMDILKKLKLKNNFCHKERIVESFNTYTKEEIAKHNTRNDLWCYLGKNVYDVTKYVNQHPGGSFILKAGGKDLEKVWKENGFGWHLQNSTVMNKLKDFKIGTIQENFKNKIENKNNSKKVIQKTAFDNLKELDFNLLFNNVKPKNYGEKLKIQDYFVLFYLFIRVLVSNKRKKEYYKIRLEPILKKYISKEGYYYLADYIAGPGFGFDKNTMSLAHYADFVLYNLQTGNKNWYVMNQPTNDGWIDLLVNEIKKRKVNIQLNQTVQKINMNKHKITNCIVNNRKVFADIHIFCVDPFRFQTILENSNISGKKYDKLNQINNQISFRIGFNEFLKLTNDNKNAKGFVLIDSAYNITFYSQTDSWCKYFPIKNPNIKTLLSGTIIQPYNNGVVYEKSALSLTIKQLKNEIIQQFLDSKEFINLIKKYNNGYQLTKNDFNYVEIYDDWYYDKKTKSLKTKNKKWVNNFLNEEFRPSQITNLSNMFIGGSHTKTSCNIWSMESAVESGKIIANLILKKTNKKQVYLYDHNKTYFSWLKPIDDLLYSFNLPNLINIILLLIIINVLIKLIKKIFTQ